MSTTPLIFFDVLGTLVQNPFYREIPAFFGLTLSELRSSSNPASWIEFECGEIPEAEYLRRMFADERKFDSGVFLAEVRRGYRWIDGMELVLAELKEQGAEMHTLSNYPVWYRDIEGRLGLSRYIPWTFVSCLSGLRKPWPETFRSAAATVGREPADCLLIDDMQENCEGARFAGMPAIWFRGAADLRGELLSRGLLRQDAAFTSSREDEG
ncbi:MAG TPA: HAD-IA family hydrolase [Bryobacteraceae bacterium]|nr:HAD-IA family hydrolase [Bryobacteraceae bacterium]